MDEKPIKLSDEYRSGFCVRIKQVNGKIASIWWEISSHNEKLDTTMKQFNDIIDRMELKNEIKIEPEKENGEIYKCPTQNCGYSFPAFPEDPPQLRQFCPNCRKRLWFKKVSK